MITQRVVLTLVLFLAVHWASTPLGFAQIIDAPSGNAVTQATGDFSDAELADGVEQVAWPNIAWPKVTLPKLTMPTIMLPKLPPLWPSSAEGDSPALLSPFVAGYAKVSTGFKKAWEGTLDLFSVFQKRETSAPAARSASKPRSSFWQRLTTRKQESKVPQTVGEFMSQPRLNP